MIQAGVRAPIFSTPPAESPEWFKLWMRQYLIPILNEIRYVHNDFESWLLPSGTVYPYTLSWTTKAPTTAYAVFLSWDGGDATTALSLSAKTVSSVTIAKVGTAPGNVSVLRVL